jgi:hypothetical protein
MTTWQTLRKAAAWCRTHWAWLALALVLLCALALVLWAGYYRGWTGLNDWAMLYTGYDRARTLWDWLQLCLLPGALVLAAGALIWAQSSRQRAWRGEQNQDAALRAYMDRISGYLLREGLPGSAPDSQVRALARGQTLALLRRVDGQRKGILLEFLYGAGLVGKDPGVELRGADLSAAALPMAYLQGAQLAVCNLNEADLEAACLDQANLADARLHRANLSRASISQADLSRATLAGADLSAAYLGGARLAGADLTRANLTGADLSGADLSAARLKGAKVTREQLAQAAGLKSAILPNGKRQG